MNQVPGYLDVIAKPLDLQTITQNLEGGTYQTLVDVWTDVKGTFENAIKYHGDRETKWIAKMAKDMIKYFNKERKSAERGKSISSASTSTSSGASKPTIKLKLAKQLPTAANKASAKASTSSEAPVSATTSVDVGSSDAAAMAPPKPKKAKLKVKLPTKKSAAEATVPVPSTTKSTNASSEVKQKPSKPVIRLKLKGPSGGSSSTSTTFPSSSSAAVSGAPASVPSSEDPPVPTPSTSKSSSGKSSKSSEKISVKLGNSRGKELPKGVVQPPAPAKPTSTSSSKEKTSAASKSSTTAPSTTSSAPTPNLAVASSSTAKSGQKRKRTKKSVSGTVKESAAVGRGGGLPSVQIQACAKVILGMKRRHQSNISWFLSPVTDKAIIQDYRAKIKHPMDISKMTTKVENKSYKSLADFCMDMRRIFSNCLCYNTSMKDSIRQVAAELLGTAEDLMAFYFAQAGNVAYPKLLYCWKLCLEVLGTLYNIVNPSDGQPTVLYFLHPVKIYCGGQFPQDYLEKVQRPMDFQTVTSNLLEGRYQSISEFATDCKLIVQNCNTYYSGREDGRLYVEQANRLGSVMTQQLEQLARYEKSPKGIAERQKANTVSLSIPRPPVSVLSSILDDLRELKYSDKATKITEPAMGPFEKPVSSVVFPDYNDFILEPMDLQSVDKKVKNGTYATPEDFEYDMSMIFRNCEKYHSERNGEHLVSMAKYGAKNFRRIFYARIKALEDPNAFSPTKAESATSGVDSTSSPPSAGGPAAKKQKVEGGGVSKGKTAPRISITLSSVSAAAASRSKSPKVTGPTQKKTTQPKASNQPLPLHIAIARVKEAFPLRRAVKSLQSWEADCARYFKELLRHPWLSAARPKFIFHVPVTMLFPELRDAYAAKIRKPMDLYVCCL